MKTLYESLLDDEDDLIADQTVAENQIEEWCKTYISGWGVKNLCSGYIRNGIIEFDRVEEVKLQLKDINMIPDYIKWGKINSINFNILLGTKMKSFKNFPQKFNKMQISSWMENMPKDFTDWGEKLQGNELTMGKMYSLKGLGGHIKILRLFCDNLLEFNCSKLTVKDLYCKWATTYKLKSFDNLPKIENEFNLDFRPEALQEAKKANIKKPNKITWDIMGGAPAFIYDILNK